MNFEVKKIGVINIYFNNFYGLLDLNYYIIVYDMVFIVREVMNNDIFR